MKFGTYRQYDSRWGKKNYNGSSTYATAACGATSCANILYAIDPSITPLTTGKYMQNHGYAIRNNGTAWSGIPACLKAFGATDVRQVDKMSDVFSLMSKGYVGVFLFRKGTKGGVTWTTSGHYIAVTGYKYANGKHYIRTFDSGGRKNDGFFAYETTMKGLIPRIWLCKVSPKKTAKKTTKSTPKAVTKPTGKYSGTIPTGTLKKGDTGEQVKNLQKFLNWYHPAWGITVGGNFKDYTEKCLRSFQKTEGSSLCDGIYGKWSKERAQSYKASTPKPTPKPKKKTNAQKLLDEMAYLAWAYGTAKKKYDYDTGAPKKVCKQAMADYGWADSKAEMSDCGNFASTVVRKSGVDKSFKALHGVKTAFPKSEKKFDIVLKGKKVPDGFLKPADMVRYKKTNGNQHVLFYYGNGKVCEASHHSLYGVIRKDTKRYNSQSKTKTIQVLRVKE